MQVFLEADQRPKHNHKDEFLPAPPQELYLLGKRTWTDVEPGEYSISDYEVSKKLIIEKMMERLNCGESKTIFRNISCIALIGLTKSRKTAWQEEEEEETRKDISTVLIHQEQSCTSEVLQGHSGRSFIDSHFTGQCHYSERFLQVPIIMSDVQSICIHIINSGLILGGQNLSDRPDSISFCLWILWISNTRILIRSTWEHRVLHGYMHTAWKKHQNTVYWVDINLALKKGTKFHQTRSNAIILYDTLPACCIPKVVRMETEEVIYEKAYVSPRPPPKISLKHDWMKELGS